MKCQWRVVDGAGTVIQAGFPNELSAYKWMHQQNNEQSERFHFWIVEKFWSAGSLR